MPLTSFWCAPTNLVDERFKSEPREAGGLAQTQLPSSGNTGPGRERGRTVREREGGRERGGGGERERESLRREPFLKSISKGIVEITSGMVKFDWSAESNCMHPRQRVNR